MPKPLRPVSDADRGPRRTRHDAILGEIRDRILSRDWPPGHQLPFETDLAAAHGVSRMTMNKVLTRLTREGFLVRRRRLGTFVAEPRGEAAVLAIHDIEAEVRALGLAYGFTLLSRALRPPDPAERDDIGLEDGPGELLFLQGLHSAGAAPFCLETRVINPAAAPGAPGQDFSGESPGKWLLKEVPWSAAEHRIRAVAADPATARLLGLDPGEACLEIRRRTESAGQWVTVVRQVYPGRRHELFARFEPRAEDG